MTNMRLKKYFSEFYIENKKMLIFATVGLSFPLILRGFFDLVRDYSKGAEGFIKKNIACYDTLLFLIGDVIPISFQFSSLIFGYIRGKKDRRSHLIVEHQ